MAIWLTAGFLVVVLVVSFANIECLLGQKEGIHLIAFVAKQLHHPFCRLFLGFITIEDTAAVLWTEVWTYAIRLCWVMNLEEEFTQALIRYLFGIELHDDGFYMMCLMVPNISIGRECLFATGITSQGILFVQR